MKEYFVDQPLAVIDNSGERIKRHLHKVDEFDTRSIDPPASTTLVLPDYLGGDRVIVDSIDRTLTQDRAVTYLFEGNGNVEVGDEANKPDLIGCIDTRIKISPIVTFELSCVLRALGNIVYSAREKLETLEDNDDQSTGEYTGLIDRYNQLSDIAENGLMLYDEKLSREEKRDESELKRKLMVMKDRMASGIPIHAKADSSQGSLSGYYRRYDYGKALKIQDDKVLKRLATLEDGKIAQAVQKVRDWSNDLERPLYAEMLLCLLDGGVPRPNNSREAIALLDAIAMLSDYNFLCTRSGEDWQGEIKEFQKYALKLVSQSIALSDILLDERSIGRLKPRARHTTGKVEEFHPTKIKNTPESRIDSV